MKKLVFLVGCFLFFGSSVRTLSGVHAAREGETLEHVNDRLYSSAVEKNDTSKNPFISALCGLNIGALDKSFMCQAGQWQHIALPQEKKVEDDIPPVDQQQVFSAQDIRDVGEILSAADDPRNASVSGEVLAFSDWFNGLLASFVRNDEAGAGRIYWPDALKDMDSNSAAALRDDVGKGILCPAAVCQESFQVPDTPTGDEGDNDINRPPPEYSGQCSYGSGYCSIENLRQYFSTELAAQQSSIICAKEDSGDPFAENKACFNTGSDYSTDYSIGIFQVNLLAHCSSLMLRDYSSEGYTGPDFEAYDIFEYQNKRPVAPCKVLPSTTKNGQPFNPQELLSRCEQAMQDPINNSKFTVLKSSNGQNWEPWSAAQACGIKGGVPLPTPSRPVPPPVGTPPPGQNTANGVLYADNNYRMFYQNDPTIGSN
ncbi:MAG TPA: hypothetical protein VJL83_00405, partial [Patescibacteria group bacterium]|nr:hypothetical protein [Patescibacteria group bacterium]